MVCRPPPAHFEQALLHLLQHPPRKRRPKVDLDLGKPGESRGEQLQRQALDLGAKQWYQDQGCYYELGWCCELLMAPDVGTSPLHALKMRQPCGRRKRVTGAVGVTMPGDDLSALQSGTATGAAVERRLATGPATKQRRTSLQLEEPARQAVSA